MIWLYRKIGHDGFITHFIPVQHSRSSQTNIYDEEYWASQVVVTYLIQKYAGWTPELLTETRSISIPCCNGMLKQLRAPSRKSIETEVIYGPCCRYSNWWKSRGWRHTQSKALITCLKLTVASNTLWLLCSIKEIPDWGEISCQRLVTANGTEALFLLRNGPLIKWHCQVYRFNDFWGLWMGLKTYFRKTVFFSFSWNFL